ncbi:MAG: cysteine--tRNA ligase [Gammaproteobacteria bacterium]|nr:MAG: cysteine--tRNA ligase [Gammaproteobacteria bacterium]
MLQIYNTLKRKKEPFKPIHEGKVGMYVCGMTVYDYCHLGHARVMVVFDVVVRWLRSLGYEVNYVRNITDIDDKIINRANENGEEYGLLTERFINAMHEDAKSLGVLPPDNEPRATGHIDKIIQLIDQLVKKDYAYVADNGDVYYRVNKFADYGKLSGKNIEELVAGARVDVAEAKVDPLDFVLWKLAKPDEPSWESPWGAGRPGWHIECSAMSTSCLGAHFDIHGGGMDLQFPHHENEIAQSEGVTGKQFVNLWMHNGFVRVAEEKMSKSLGNFFTVREILQRYQPEEVRYFILTSHYRSPLNYSDENLDLARHALMRLYTALRDTPVEDVAPVTEYMTMFAQAMNDDFNTPVALSVLFEVAHEINKLRDADMTLTVTLATTLRTLGNSLGILQDDPENYLKAAPLGSDSGAGFGIEQIEQMINRRNQARSEREFNKADQIRDELLGAGIVLEDGAGGTTWRRQ